jgi:hypothetical protein
MRASRIELGAVSATFQSFAPMRREHGGRGHALASRVRPRMHTGRPRLASRPPSGPSPNACSPGRGGGRPAPGRGSRTVARRAGSGRTPLRICRGISSGFAAGSCQMWYGRDRGDRADAGGEVRGALPASGRAAAPAVDGAEARALGHGGIRAVARAAGVAENTVARGVPELDAGGRPLGRTRRPGGGRRRLADLDPGLRTALLALVEPDERGDPASPLRWTTKSTRALAAQLTAQGHRVGADTVADLLRQAGSACRQTSRPSRARGTRTGMRSSATSTRRSRTIRTVSIR